MIFALRAVEELGIPRDTGQPGAGSQNQVSKTPEEARESSAGKGPCCQDEFGDLSLITGAHMPGGEINSSKLSSDLLSCCGTLKPTYPPPHGKKEKPQKEKRDLNQQLCLSATPTTHCLG